MSDQPATPNPSEEATRPSEADGNPSLTFGAYRLLQRIGEGGMGEVWRAEQVRPVRRQVALKVIKLGMDTARVMARFEAERQALAVMDHPAIARVFDGGTSPSGRPYFVMEYVPGETFTSYCNRHRLVTRERLGLFLDVCDGVHHAHQKGVIHRDLKPSNILVTLLDGRPVAKIIDFGVAKAVSQPLTDHPLYTEVGTLVGTPEYMSPEQADMTGLDIDTRTDVYALGVVLYELLTGTLPFDSKALRQQGLDAIRRTIREVEPPMPSGRVAQVTATGVPVSQRPDLSGVARELRRDLDWITMKALDKDRARRYGTVAELASDVRRHLEHRAVVAGPPSTFYRAGKFIRRHRVGVAAVVAAAALLVVFAVTVGIQARRLAVERDRANREARIAGAVNDFLRTDLLAAASANEQAAPNTKPDPELKVRTALDRAAARISGAFQDEPLIATNNLGIAFKAEGRYAEAEAIIRDVLRARRRALGRDHPDTLRSANAMAGLDAVAGRYAQAEALFAEVLEARRRVVGAEHPDTLSTMTALGRARLQQQNYAGATPMLADALRSYVKVRPDHWDRFTCQALLGASLAGQRDFPEAERQLVPGYEGMLAHKDTMPPEGKADLDLAGSRIVAMYRVWNREDKAAEWTRRIQPPPTAAAAPR